MQTLNVTQLKSWATSHPDPRIRKMVAFVKRCRTAELPNIPLLNVPFYHVYSMVRHVMSEFARVFIYTPAFKGRTQTCGKRLYLYTGVPYISGPLTLKVGDDCRISGQTTFTGRTSSKSPTLEIGNNVGIGWQTTIAVGLKVIIKDNVRIAGRSGLYGYPGHPLDAKARASGKADTDEQIGSICLERDVWLANNVSVMAGVTIGRGTIVAAGSIVTKDLPPFVLAGGNPARVIKTLINQNQEAS